MTMFGFGGGLWRPILRILGIVLVVFAVVFLFARCEQKTWSDVKQAYAQGYIDENADVVTGDVTAAYTEKLISCTGFKIRWEKSIGAYFVVHFYNADGSLCESVKVTGSGYSVDIGDMPEGVVGIRVSVHLNDKTSGLTRWDRWTMSNKLKISFTGVTSEVGSSGTTEPDPTDPVIDLSAPVPGFRWEAFV